MSLPLKSFGDVCGFVRGPFGGSLKKSIFKDSGYAVYEQKHAIYNQFSNIRYFIDDEKFDEMKRFELFSGDLIMSCSGTIGKVSIVPKNIQKGIINQALLKISPSEKINVNFLKYWMDSENFKDSISKHSKGVAVKNVASVKVLKEIEVPVPKIEIQKQIVKILDNVFEAIDKAKGNIENNIQNSKELFQSRLNEIFSQKGEGWEEKTLKEVCSIITDGTHQTPKYFDSGYTFLSSKNVTTGVIDWDNIKYIDEEQHVQMQKRVSPQLNDVLLAKNGTTGVAAIVDREVKFDIYVSLALLRSTEKLDPKYLLHFVNSSTAKAQFNKRLKGVGVPNLHLKEIREVIINYPVDKNEQKNIVEYIDNLICIRNGLLDNYKQKLQNLEELKKSILQKAFSGELI